MPEPLAGHRATTELVVPSRVTFTGQDFFLPRSVSEITPANVILEEIDRQAALAPKEPTTVPKGVVAVPQPVLPPQQLIQPVLPQAVPVASPAEIQPLPKPFMRELYASFAGYGTAPGGEPVPVAPQPCIAAPSFQAAVPPPVVQHQAQLPPLAQPVPLAAPSAMPMAVAASDPMARRVVPPTEIVKVPPQASPMVVPKTIAPSPQPVSSPVAVAKPAMPTVAAAPVAPTYISSPPAAPVAPTYISSPPAAPAAPTYISSPPAAPVAPTYISSPPAAPVAPTYISSPPIAPAQVSMPTSYQQPGVAVPGTGLAATGLAGLATATAAAPQPLVTSAKPAGVQTTSAVEYASPGVVRPAATYVPAAQAVTVSQATMPMGVANTAPSYSMPSYFGTSTSGIVPSSYQPTSVAASPLMQQRSQFSSTVQTLPSSGYSVPGLSQPSTALAPTTYQSYASGVPSYVQPVGLSSAIQTMPETSVLRMPQQSGLATLSYQPASTMPAMASPMRSAVGSMSMPYLPTQPALTQGVATSSFMPYSSAMAAPYQPQQYGSFPAGVGVYPPSGFSGFQTYAPEPPQVFGQNSLLTTATQPAGYGMTQSMGYGGYAGYGGFESYSRPATTYFSPSVPQVAPLGAGYASSGYYPQQTMSMMPSTMPPYYPPASTTFNLPDYGYGQGGMPLRPQYVF